MVNKSISSEAAHFVDSDISSRSTNNTLLANSYASFRCKIDHLWIGWRATWQLFLNPENILLHLFNYSIRINILISYYVNFQQIRRRHHTYNPLVFFITTEVYTKVDTI
ncbi:hypothetical protein A9C11_30045 [Pseudomonas citronellolis]|uniref:Uncharacterized protein n=1 Tax=Pseudomonas citronellolis TaxID=53408 RepID=A0A1A9KJH4_9PSED|nr:hypothetical protein A9C11_30045 [Pseudomonas citronellolis]